MPRDLRRRRRQNASKTPEAELQGRGPGRLTGCMLSLKFISETHAGIRQLGGGEELVVRARRNATGILGTEARRPGPGEEDRHRQVIKT